MRQLVQTLLILGTVGACERAQPVVDARARPAVGNLGQAGRPAVAAPVVTPAPIVLPPPPARRAQRVQRAVAPHAVPLARPLHTEAIQSEQTVASPLLDERKRPGTANMGRMSAMRILEEEPAPPAPILAQEAR